MSSSTIECTSGQIKHYTFETLTQRVNLTYNYETKEDSKRDRKKLPCLLMEGGCKTTTLDSFAYTWDTPENCVMTKNSHTRCKNAALFFDNGSKGKSILFSYWIQWHWKRNENRTKSFPWKLWALWKIRKIVQDEFWKSVCELPRRFRNARWRTMNKGIFI